MSTAKTQSQTQPLQRFSGEWETKRLGEIFTIFAGSSKSQYITQGGRYIVVDMGSVTTDGQLIISKFTDYEGDFLKEGDLVMPKDDIGGGKIIGKVAYIDANNLYVLSDHVYVLRLIEEGFPKFFSYLINRYETNRTLKSKVGGSAQLGLSRKAVVEQEVPIPPYEEQRAIAEVLSDVDDLLNALEALITKKQGIKLATMQQLLTGRTRLPGFSGEWEKTKISNLLAYSRPDPYIVQSTEYTERGDVPVLTANKAFILGYTAEVSGICHNFPVIVFDDFTTDSKYATFPFKVKSAAIKLLYPKHERVSLKYVFERMQLINFPLGNHKRYYISEYQNLELYVPDYEEQEAIASVLSDMDAELAALEARLEKTRAIKRGMMQDLLTGRVRLVKTA